MSKPSIRIPGARVARTGRASLITSLARFLNRHVRPSADKRIKVQQFNMYAGTLDRMLALYSLKVLRRVTFETEVIRQVVRDGMVAVDVGANIGYYTLVLSELVGAKGRVFAFEPDPDNYFFLMKNIRANNCSNVVPVPMALSDRVAPTTLYRREEHRGDHSIFASGDRRDSIVIDATTLDGYLPSGQKVDFVKMDIQGAEYLAFLGMRETLERNPNVALVSEFWPDEFQRCGFAPEEYLARLADCRFRAYVINEKDRRLEWVESGAEFVKGLAHNRYVNLLLQR